MNNTQEINRKYEYKILHTVDSNFEEKIKEAETDGWEVIGQVLLNRGGAYNNDTYVRVPMRKAINKAAEEALKQTPKVGDWFKCKLGDNLYFGRIKNISGRNFYYFGIDGEKWDIEDYFMEYSDIYNNLKILTESEVIDFLSKESEKRYKEGDMVCSIRTKENFVISLNDITCIFNNYFIYKGISVLDLNTGEWAEVVEKKEEDYDFEYIGIGQYRLNLTEKTLEVGKYKLVKI